MNRSRLAGVLLICCVMFAAGCNGGNGNGNGGSAINGAASATTTAPPTDGGSAKAFTKVEGGFVTTVEDGRLWVFREGSKGLAEYKEHGELAKHVIRPAAGPDRTTLKAPDSETADAFIAMHVKPSAPATDAPPAAASLDKPGFVTVLDDGRLWVFREGSSELADYRAHGELAKHVIRPAAGPNRMTLKAPDGETIDAYLAQ